MVALKTEVWSASQSPFGESSCYSNFLPRFDNSIYLGEIWNRSFSFFFSFVFCREIQQMLNNCTFEKRSLAESLRLWNPMWWQLFVSRSCGSCCWRAVCAWHTLLLVHSKGECAAGAALPVVRSPKDAFLASLAIHTLQELFFPSSQLHRLIIGCEDSGPDVLNDSVLPSLAPALEPPAIHHASAGVVQICFTLATSLSLLIIHSRAF